jgi:hypothetical protein
VVHPGVPVAVDDDVEHVHGQVLQFQVNGPAGHGLLEADLLRIAEMDQWQPVQAQPFKAFLDAARTRSPE